MTAGGRRTIVYRRKVIQNDHRRRHSPFATEPTECLTKVFCGCDICPVYNWCEKPEKGERDGYDYIGKKKNSDDVKQTEKDELV